MPKVMATQASFIPPCDRQQLQHQQRGRQQLLLQHQHHLPQPETGKLPQRYKLHLSPPISVTRVGDFCKFLVPNFLTKVAKIFGHY